MMKLEDFMNNSMIKSFLSVKYYDRKVLIF